MRAVVVHRGGGQQRAAWGSSLWLITQQQVQQVRQVKAFRIRGLI